MKKQTQKNEQSKKAERTFNLSEIILYKLEEVSTTFHINKATIVRMAVIHGMERMKNKYRPKRTHQKRLKKKYKITLSYEAWKTFEKLKESVRYQLDENIPDGELIEIFIEIELKKFLDIIEKYEDYFEKTSVNTNKKVILLNEYETIQVEANVPKYLYDQIKEKQEQAVLKATQINKYLVASGVIQEYLLKDFDTIHTNVDILEEIEILGLDRLKAITLIRYLIANDIIIWKDAYRNDG